MPFADKIRALAERVPQTVEHLGTEEATKNALVMPFIAALGYDVFNPLEVVPEYTADVGTKKGEKVDYAILRDDEIIMIWEAKKAGEDLSRDNVSQLYRYFSVTKARIAILTNGVEYRFYSDLDDKNKMDTKPFLVIDLTDLREDLLSELQRITKDAFDLENMLASANDLKHLRELRAVFEAQFAEPDEEFVRFFFNRATENARFGKNARELFGRLVREAFSQFVADRVGSRLRSALVVEGLPPVGISAPTTSVPAAVSLEALPEEEDDEPDNGVVTTEEEMQGFYVVKAIACAVLPAERIFFRDTKSYFGVLVDDNNRKPLVRLHFDRKTKYIGLLDEGKSETRHEIAGPEGIYAFAEEIKAAARRYVVIG